MLLKIKNLSKTYDSKNYALRDVSFNVSEGEFIAVVGLSGAGKSTFIRCINRLVPFSEGEIFFNGENLHNANRYSLKKIRSKIGMVFQHHNLIEQTTVLSNVLHGRLGETSFIRSALGLYRKEDKEEAYKLLKTVGLYDYKDKKAKTLSGGQMQRVGICRALMQKPKLLLADEPIASLDPVSAETVMETMKAVNEKTNLTIIVNLHQVDFAKKYASRIIGMKAGKIFFDGTPKSLTEDIIKEIYS
ncbi:MAG: phosphonate ABC transporter ATP-binding protein [Defluviitaleaceae bacterium]|nr:phosphonate ABC transporter ATP-binding protein [Defluviitaleaceae bacterium]